MNQQKFYVCRHCRNLIGMLENAGVPILCCGEAMAELVPNTVDAAKEKHVPVVRVSGNEVTVEVGSVAHPMLAEHHIAWIYLQTSQGGQRKKLTVPGEAGATFLLAGEDRPIAVYAYCNLHGLWMADC